MTAVHTLPLPFGRHKGKTLAELMRTDPGYVAWLADEADRPVWRKLAAAALGLADEADGDDDDTEQDKTLAAIAMPLIVFEWQEHMNEKFGGGPDGPVLDAGLKKLKELCSKYTRRPWPEATD